MTVIRYIENESKRFHTYVANCVALIREDSSPSQWRYVDTKSSPADDASRGVSAESFIQNNRWIKGPAFLLKPQSEWVKCPPYSVELADDDPEVKREPKSFVVHVSEAYTSFVFIVERFSSWFTLLKFITLCLRCQKRFVRRKREARQDVQSITKEPTSDLITCSELENAEREIVKFNQNFAFPEELEAIKRGNSVKKSSAIAKLVPILVSGLLRVGGRLSRAPLSEDSKHQTIILKESHLAVLLVSHFHQKSGHSGREHVLALLRERYWLIGANSLVRSVLLSCFTCRKR